MAAAAKGSLTPTRLYLVRHGQVADGHTDRYHGNNDIGLSRQRGAAVRGPGGAA